MTAFGGGSWAPLLSRAVLDGSGRQHAARCGCDRCERRMHLRCFVAALGISGLTTWIHGFCRQLCSKLRRLRAAVHALQLFQLQMLMRRSCCVGTTRKQMGLGSSQQNDTPGFAHALAPANAFSLCVFPPPLLLTRTRSRTTVRDTPCDSVPSKLPIGAQQASPSRCQKACEGV